MQVLQVVPYKVLHLEYNEVKVLARLQKAIGESHTSMCCCFCRKFTLLFCSQSGTEVTTTSLPVVCHLISVRVTAPWLEGKLCSPCLFMLHIQLLSLGSHPLQWGHDKVPDFTLRLRHLRLCRRFSEICSRITPGDVWGSHSGIFSIYWKTAGWGREVCQLVLSAVDLKRLWDVCL